MAHAFHRVIVHPLVLLSAVDHYKRLDQPRVVGTLLGRIENGVAHITNSYAVPFDECPKNKNIWFFDTSYNENMYRLFNKVNSREVILGWYHTSPRLHENDLQITQTFQSYTKDPILTTVNLEPSHTGAPIQCYRLERENQSDTGMARFVFGHVPFAIEAEEAEEVGVEQLVEDIRDVNIGDLANKIESIKMGLRELSKGLAVLEEHMRNVETGQLPYSAETMEILQEIMNYVPRRYPSGMGEYMKELELNTYVCSAVRSVVLLNDVEESKQSA